MDLIYIGLSGLLALLVFGMAYGCARLAQVRR